MTLLLAVVSTNCPTETWSTRKVAEGQARETRDSRPSSWLQT